MAMNPAAVEQHDVPNGARIYTSDAHLLGSVDGVDSGYLRVSTSPEASFWLPLHAIQAQEPDRVVMIFPLAQLSAYQETAPPP